MKQGAYKRREPQRPSPADAELRKLLRRLFASMPMSRAQLADALSEKLQEPVSLTRLDQFVASTKASAKLPAYFVGPLTEILGSDAIVVHLLNGRTKKEFEFVHHVRELRRIAAELLRESKTEGRDA